MHLNISFEDNQLVLSVQDDDPLIDQQLAEFGKLSLGKQRLKKLVKNGTDTLIPLTEYILQREERTQSPEYRELRLMVDNLANGFRQLTKRLDDIDHKFRSYREQQRPSRDKRTQPFALLMRRIVAGDKKALRLKAQVEAAGYLWPEITQAGNISREKGQDHRTVMCFDLLERLQDQLGDHHFQQVLAVMSTFTDVQPRASYLEAIVFCLYKTAPPLTAEAFYVEAEPYFTMNWGMLWEKLQRMPRLRHEPYGNLLGQVILKEKTLPE